MSDDLFKHIAYTLGIIFILMGIVSLVTYPYEEKCDELESNYAELEIAYNELVIENQTLQEQYSEVKIELLETQASLQAMELYYANKALLEALSKME